MKHSRKPWGRVTLHRHLLNLLERPSTTLKYKAIRGTTAAQVYFETEFPPASIDIEVDANNTPVLQYVIHELIHVVISELVIGKFDETLEEVLVVALDGHIFNFVSKSKARLAKWNSLIERKLVESDRPLKPIEQIVERK